MPIGKKLSARRLQKMCAALIRPLDARQTQPPLRIYRTLRGLKLRPHQWQWCSLTVTSIGNSLEEDKYITYFWWAHNDQAYDSVMYPPTYETIYSYWYQILTLLNEDPHILLREHRQRRQRCLYRYRPASRV